MLGMPLPEAELMIGMNPLFLTTGRFFKGRF
jgi:hypothetical protein